MRRHLIRLSIVVLAIIGTTCNAVAEKRVALVIGVDRYQHLAPLANPGRDAKAIAQVLRKAGFETSLHIDLDQASLQKALADFSTQSAGASQAIIYYAGHGMSVVQGGQLVNVIAPSDSRISCADRSATRTLAMERVFAATAGIPERVFLFDACRNDPFLQCAAGSDVAARGFGYRAVGQEALDGTATPNDEGEGRGLARTGSRRSASALIAFSTDLGAVALDGKPGTHSPFADELLKQLGAAPDLPIRELLDRTSQAVAKRTAHLQVPWVVSKGGEPQLCLSGNCQTRTRLEAGRTAAEVSILLKQARDRIDAQDYDGALVYGTEALSLSQANADGTQLAAAEEIVRTSLTARRPFRELKGSTARVTNLSFSKSGRYAMALSQEEVKLRVRLGSPGWTFAEPHSELDRTATTGGNSSLSATVSPDDIQIQKEGTVPGSRDFSTVRVWDAGSGEPLHLFRDYEDDLMAAYFRGDADEVVTVSLKGQISIWELGSGKRLLRTSPLKHTISAVAISADGSRLALGTGDQDDGGMNPVTTLRGVSYAINLTTGKLVASIKSVGQLGSLALNPDGTLIAVAFTDKKRGFVWNLDHRREQFPTSGSSYFTSIQEFSPDGRYLALTRSGHEFDVYEVEAGRKLKRTFSHRTGSFLGGLVFDPESTRIVSLASDGYVSVWTLRSQLEPTSFELRDGHLRQVQFSNDGKSLLVGVGQLVALIDLESMKTRTVLSVGGITKSVAYTPVFAGFNALAQDPATGRLLVKFNDTPLRQYATTEPEGAIRIPARFSFGTDHAGYSRDGKWLVVAEANRLRVFDAATGANQTEINYQYAADASRTAKLIDIRGWTNDPGSRSGQIAFVGTYGDIGILQLPGLEIVKKLPSNGRQVSGARLSPDGRLLMLAQYSRFTGGDTCSEYIIRIIRLSTGDGFEFCGPYFRSHSDPPSFSSDGQYLASVGYDGRLRIFDLNKRTVQEPVPGRKFSNVSPVFTPDGRRILVAESKGVSIIGVGEGEEPIQLPGIEGTVIGLAVSPDGLRAAVSSMAQTVQIFDAASGLVQEVYRGFSRISNGAFHPASTGLVMASFTAVETRTFQLEGKALLAQAKALSPGCLSVSVRKKLQLQTPVPEWCAMLGKVSILR